MRAPRVRRNISYKRSYDEERQRESFYEKTCSSHKHRAVLRARGARSSDEQNVIRVRERVQFLREYRIRPKRILILASHQCE